MSPQQVDASTGRKSVRNLGWDCQVSKSALHDGLDGGRRRLAGQDGMAGSTQNTLEPWWMELGFNLPSDCHEGVDDDACGYKHDGEEKKQYGIQAPAGRYGTRR